MARSLVWIWIALFALIGCPDNAADDDDTVGDDDDTDLGCNAPDERALGWDEEVDWWMDTAADARDFYVGEWEGTIPWSDGTSAPISLSIDAPLGDAVLTTYPDAEDVHAADACIAWATITVPYEVVLGDDEMTISGEAEIQISEQSVRWELYAAASMEEYEWYFSLGAWPDNTALVPTLLARPTVINGDSTHELDGEDYAVLTHPDEPAA